MNKTIAIKNLLFKQKIKLLTDNNFKKSGLWMLKNMQKIY